MYYFKIPISQLRSRASEVGAILYTPDIIKFSKIGNVLVNRKEYKVFEYGNIIYILTPNEIEMQVPNDIVEGSIDLTRRLSQRLAVFMGSSDMISVWSIFWGKVSKRTTTTPSGVTSELTWFPTFFEISPPEIPDVVSYLNFIQSQMPIFLAELRTRFARRFGITIEEADRILDELVDEELIYRVTYAPIKFYRSGIELLEKYRIPIRPDVYIMPTLEEVLRFINRQLPIFPEELRSRIRREYRLVGREIDDLFDKLVDKGWAVIRAFRRVEITPKGREVLGE